MIGVQTKSTVFRLIGHALIIGLCLLVVFPFYWMLVTSVRPSSDFFNISLFPTGFTLEHYQYVLSNLPFGRLFLNTAAMASARTLAQVLTALLAAYAFARWNFVGKRFLFAMFTFTWLVPQQVTMIPNYVLVSQLGWLNALAGLIVPSMVSTFALFLLFQQIKGFPQDLFDAARVDGGSSWMILWQVLVPNLRAVIASLAILQFISAWNDYFWPLLVSNRMETGVLQLGLQAFFTQEGDLWGPMMAAATLTALPIFVVYVILQRQVVDSFIKSGLR